MTLPIACTLSLIHIFPQEYAEHFKVNGMLLPGYTIEGEEPPQQPQAATIVTV